MNPPGGVPALKRIGLAFVMAAALGLPSSAVAAPGDLDPSFGSGGLTSLPSGDRYQAEDTPLRQAGGRIVIAGLLRNASDRLFLEGIRDDGTIDSTFGTSGEVHTNTIAAARRAATGLLPDGRIVVAGASSRVDRINVERFQASGQVDTTMGGSGRLTADLGGTQVMPTAVAGQSDGKTLVAVIAD